LISIDKDAFLGLNNLELVCLNDNPLQELFPNQLTTLCDSNPKCTLRISDKCKRQATLTPSTTKTNDKFEEFINAFKLDQEKQDEKIFNLEETQKLNGETLNKLLDKMDNLVKNFSDINKRIDLLLNKVNELNKTLVYVNHYFREQIFYSLAHDISINKMKSQGYRVVYDYVYNHVTTLAELNEIKSKCSAETILCAGGVASNNSDNLLLVSCGNCHSVLKQTLLNKPILNNGAYWYFTDKYSFGFSPSYNINQVPYDYFDCSPCREERLSWTLCNVCGGWRLGNLTSLFSYSYRKIMLLV